MTEPYYLAEHFAGYARLRRAGLPTWDALHGEASGYDDFGNRAFLDRVLPHDGARRTVFEYGCGTGPAACFLADRGYLVHAVDLVPDAIAVAKQQAAERGLVINFEVVDVCRWGTAQRQYDYVLDSYCLQSIVTDRDRATVLDGVRARLADDGCYLLSTVVYDPDRGYGDDQRDPSNGIVWTLTETQRPGTRIIDGRRYLPSRRHHTVAALTAELAAHGLVITELEVSGAAADLVARGAA